MSTPILPFAVWLSGTNQNSIPANDNSLRNQILNGLVISDSVTAQPVSPADGDIYIIPAGATGTQWATFDMDDLAIFMGGTWYAFAPVEGIVVNIAGALFTWEGSAGYVALGGGGGGSVSSVSGSGGSTGLTLSGGPTGAVTLTLGGTLSVANGGTGQTSLAASIAAFQGNGLDADAAGFRGIPQNSQSGNYTTVASDAGKEIYHPSGGGSGDTFTIDSNTNVAYEIGTAISFCNMDANALSIAITSDTMYLAGAGTTGTRSLAQFGTAVAVKKTATTWLISGINLT